MKSPINFLSPNPLKRIVDVGSLFMNESWSKIVVQKKEKPNQIVAL